MAGTVFGGEHPRIVRIGSFHTEIVPDGSLLLIFGQDKPGQIGSVGEVLGRAAVNIARMTFSREQAGGNSLLSLNLDAPCPPEALESIRALPSVREAVPLSL